MPANVSTGSSYFFFTIRIADLGKSLLAEEDRLLAKRGENTTTFY